MSSAMLIAPAVHAAIGQRIGVAPDLNDIFAEDVSPFETCLEDCIENLQTDLDIFRPDFARADPVVAKVWAAGVSEKMHKTEKSKMNNLFATLPLRDSKRAEFQNAVF